MMADDVTPFGPRDVVGTVVVVTWPVNSVDAEAGSVHSTPTRAAHERAAS